MGRYVSGDWKWKFAFGDQGSTFGEVLEEITKNCEECYVSRFVGTRGEGEQVELNIVNSEEFVKVCKEFLGDFKVKTEKEMEEWCTCKVKFGNEYWDKCMIWKFLKDNTNKDGKIEFTDEETYNFYVEY